MLEWRIRVIEIFQHCPFFIRKNERVLLRVCPHAHANGDEFLVYVLCTQRMDGHANIGKRMGSH